MGPATIEAIAGILAEMAGTSRAIFCSAADANPAGERYGLRHQELAACAAYLSSASHLQSNRATGMKS